MNMSSPEEDARFRQAILDSWEAVWAVARYIHRLGGREVYIAPLIIRPSFEERHRHGDRGDIHVRRVGKQGWARVEAKGRTFAFTGPDDFPFPTLYVDRPNRLQKHGPANAYFNVNHDLTHAAVILGKTRDRWLGPTTYFDHTRGHDACSYEAPLDLIKFVRLR